MALHQPRGTDSIETLHPGGEIKTNNINEVHNHLDLFFGAFYLFFSCLLSAEGHLNELYITNLPFEGCVVLFHSSNALFLFYGLGFMI